ncbi:hypothetical protein ACR6RB_004551 [Yersinia enterocolitica]|nr:hypothetical protein [Yersinia enterocolitica]
MKELNSFTVERLEEILNFDLPRHPAALEEIVALARIALAAKSAEPVSLEFAIEKFKAYNIGFPVEKLKADFVISWCLTNLTPQLNSPEIPEGWISIPRDMLADYRDVKNAEVENYKAGFAGYYNREGTRWARDFADLCEELAAIDKVLAAAPEKPL